LATPLTKDFIRKKKYRQLGPKECNIKQRLPEFGALRKVLFYCRLSVVSLA
jgi:hypothetical protein